MTLPPIAVYLYQPASLRHEFAEDFAKAMPRHPVKDSEETLSVHGLDIFIGVVAVFPRPLERREYERLRQIRSDIAVLEAADPDSARVEELRRPAEAMYNTIVSGLLCQVVLE